MCTVCMFFGVFAGPLWVSQLICWLYFILKFPLIAAVAGLTVDLSLPCRVPCLTALFAFFSKLLTVNQEEFLAVMTGDT